MYKLINFTTAVCILDDSNVYIPSNSIYYCPQKITYSQYGRGDIDLEKSEIFSLGLTMLRVSMTLEEQEIKHLNCIKGFSKIKALVDKLVKS